MDYTYRERHGEAIYRFKDGMPAERLLPPQRRAELPGGRRRRSPARRHRRRQYYVGLGLPAQRIDVFPQSRKILADILAGVPADEQAKIAGGNTPPRVLPLRRRGEGALARADRP